MANKGGLSRMAGRLGGWLLLVGFLSFLFGTFEGPRIILFVGIALILLSYVAFGVEEFGPRQHG